MSDNRIDQDFMQTLRARAANAFGRPSPRIHSFVLVNMHTLDQSTTQLMLWSLADDLNDLYRSEGKPFRWVISLDS